MPNKTKAVVTKKQQIKSHLIKKGYITVWEAINKYSETRLSAVVFSLKKEGMDISGVRVERKGKPSYFKYVHNKKWFVGSK